MDFTSALYLGLRHPAASLESRGIAPATRFVFPVQGIGPLDHDDVQALLRALESRGVRAVMQTGRCQDGASLTFVLTARHGARSLTRTAHLVADMLDDHRQMETLDPV